MLIHLANASAQLQQMVARFSGVRLATPEDAEALAQFINETAMSAGHLRVGFTRGSDYFALLRLQAEKFAALVCEDQGRIVGVGALTVRTCYVRGQRARLGYFQDLRVLPAAPHRTRQNFYNCFAEFVKVCPQLEDFDNCSLFITAILDQNTPAKASLSRQSFPLEYTRLTHYNAHLWPKIPFAKLLSNNGSLSSPNFTDILAFYQENLGRFAFDLTIEDLQRLKEHVTPVVIKENNRIVASCLLAQTENERQLHAEQDQFKINFNSTGTYITAFRISKAIPAEQSKLVRRKLLTKALLESCKLPGLFTGYIEAENEPSNLSLLQRITSYQIQGSLYRVFHPEHAALPGFSKGFLRPSHVPYFDWIFS